MTSRPMVHVVGENGITNGSVSKMFYDRGYRLTVLQEKADIVCLIGGFDINPAFYHEKVGPKRVSTNISDDIRDKTAWMRCTEDQMKVGICRGGQFLNIMNGGGMYQHVNNHLEHHRIYDTLFNREILVTSRHHQMMKPTSKAEILGYSEGIATEYWGEDGKTENNISPIEPEVLYYEETSSLCFQPHPEWIISSDEHQKYFFDIIELLH